MDERKDTIDAGGHPGEEEGDEKERCDLRVAESGTIGFHRCFVLALGGIRITGAGNVDGVGLTIAGRIAGSAVLGPGWDTGTVHNA